MKITLIANGKTEEPFFRDAFAFYTRRVEHYVNFNVIEVPPIKNAGSMGESLICDKEALLTEKFLLPGDHIVLLDEKGQEYTSREFAAFLQTKMNAGLRNLVFITGGPYGFGESLYKKAQEKMSLSKMTFPHQMARVFFAEQLYRAYSILRNESYHHG